MKFSIILHQWHPQFQKMSMKMEGVHSSKYLQRSSDTFCNRQDSFFKWHTWKERLILWCRNAGIWEKQRRSKKYLIERSNKKTIKSDIFNFNANCFKSIQSNKKLNNFNRVTECDDLAFHQATDQTWAIRSTIPKNDFNIKAPNCINSLYLTNQSKGLSGSPTDWSNLFTVLKLVHGINVVFNSTRSVCS